MAASPPRSMVAPATTSHRRVHFWSPARHSKKCRSLLGETDGRRKADSVLVARGQVRPFMAGYPERALPPGARTGPGEVSARDESDGADGQTRCRGASAGGERLDRRRASWSMMA